MDMDMDGHGWTWTCNGHGHGWTWTGWMDMDWMGHGLDGGWWMDAYMQNTKYTYSLLALNST